MKKQAIAFIIFTLISLSISARPARNGIYTICQPDGTSFQAKIYGDEFYRIKTTAEGQAIIQDEDGWWCYAKFNQSGERNSSGYRVGASVPSNVLFESCNIPYDKLAEKARTKRQTAQCNRLPLMKRLMQQNQVETKSGSQSVTKRGIIILAEFSDVPFKFKKNNFTDLLTKDGYSYNGATGSAKEYFDDQFEGRVQFEFEVSDIIKLPNKRAYYGSNDEDGNDKNPAQMVKEACEAADDYIDFSIYDQDGDGEIDNVFVFFSGEDEAEGFDEEYIWSHAWWVKNGAGIRCTLDGKILNSYACTSELSVQNDKMETDLTGIGTFCHEYSHTFGLPDLYDTDYDNAGGWAAGTWLKTSLMDGGNQNNVNNTPPYYNAIEREILGLAEPVVLKNDGAYTLTPVQTNKIYRLDTDRDGEYYLLECRSNDGWDKYIGGNGLLVYHIDKTSTYIKRWQEDNTVNAYQSHQCADLIEADGRTDAITERTYMSAFRNISGIFFPYNSVNSLTPTSSPGIKYWSGQKGEISITDIQRSGKDITFNVVGHSGTTTPPTVMSYKTEVFMDAAIINFESSWAHEGPATVTWGRVGQGSNTTEVMPYQSGKYSVILENLIPGNKTYSVSICFKTNGISGNKTDISFMTSKEAPVDWPYIYIGKNKAKTDGSFVKGTKIALRVYNAQDAKNIRWTFNDEDIVPGGDGYYAIQENGSLKAYVSWEDGSQDIIEKKIYISGAE